MLRRVAGLALALFCWVGPAQSAPVAQAALKVPLATKVVFLGLARAGERVVAAGERGIVIYSDNAGASWTQADVPVRGTLTALTFIDPRIGFAVGHDAVILKTVDAGASWSLLNFEPESQNVMLNVHFRDARTGWVTGSNGQLWTTHDGGANWDRQTLAVEDWYQNHIFDLAWLPDGTILAVAEKGVLYRSISGQRDFMPIDSPYEGSFFGALTFPAGRMLIFGMNGHAFVTDDDGTSWQRVVTNTQQFLLSGSLLADGSALLVGGGGTLLWLRPDALTVQAARPLDRIGFTAALPAGDDLYIATAAGGVRKLPLAQIFK
ncbi:YCF48-related protein [Immundisolibacter sp.]|uniref:YCF48-related protein n=1 Tax=Immundisolibacter sp. TaxID=1934948 RepID=UPI003568338F